MIVKMKRRTISILKNQIHSATNAIIINKKQKESENYAAVLKHIATQNTRKLKAVFTQGKRVSDVLCKKQSHSEQNNFLTPQCKLLRDKVKIVYPLKFMSTFNIESMPKVYITRGGRNLSRIRLRLLIV